MQITFDPTDPHERELAAQFIMHIDGGTLAGGREFSAPAAGTPLALAGIGTDATGEDTRSAAAVFGSAGPLSAVQLGAGATPLPSAPAGPLGSLPQMPGGMPGLALGALPAGAPSASALPGNPAGGVELDAEGIPWHHEIHASTKTKTKAGVWTKLRGLNDEAKYNRIKAELKALHAAPVGAPPPAAAPVQQQLAPLAPLQPLQPLAPLPPATPTVPATFDEMMPRITAGIGALVLPADVVTQACAARQLPAGVVALISRPDYVPFIWADIKAAYPAFTG